MPSKIDLTGMVFGRLTVIKENGKQPSKGLMWLCKCECGKTKTIGGQSLKKGRTVSCGCYNKQQIIKRQTKHGQRKIKTTEYIAWSNMKKRCYDLKYDIHNTHGGRGIIVCERWRNSFENFFADMGKKPSPELSLDRIDNNGNYEPGNCRWATPLEQGKNTRTNVWFEYSGIRMIQNEWARFLRITSNDIRQMMIRKTFAQCCDFFMKKKNISIESLLRQNN